MSYCSELKRLKSQIDHLDALFNTLNNTVNGIHQYSRFGIEDTTTDVDRSVDLGNRSLYINGHKDIIFDNRLVGGQNSGLKSTVSADNSYIQLYSGDGTGNNSILEINPLGIKATKNGITHQVPISVNGQFADNNGNVAISVGGIIDSVPTNGSTNAVSSDGVFDALSTKQSTLVSNTNIKTINSTSLLGSGNIAVQPTLVSGTNIKSINGFSLLGSGDITISGGSASRFGIEDITSDADRYFDGRPYGFDVLSSSLSLTVDTPSVGGGYLTILPNTGETMLAYEHAANSRGFILKSDSIQYFIDDIYDNRFYLPLTVNGEHADTTGNITISTGSGGGGSRFAVSGEDDIEATADRSMDMGSFGFDIRNSYQVRLYAEETGQPDYSVFYADTSSTDIATYSENLQSHIITVDNRVNLFSRDQTGGTTQSSSSLSLWSNGLVQIEGDAIKVKLGSDTEKFLPLSVNGNFADSSGNINDAFISVTKAEIDTLITNSSLIPGKLYKIDLGADDHGIFLKALTPNKMAQEGTRLMLVPKTYDVNTVDGNSWKGMWKSTNTYAVDDLAIYYGYVFKNLTGDAGTDDFSDVQEILDATNWVMISKESFTNNEYVEKEYGISFDWNMVAERNSDYTTVTKRGVIIKQWDDYDNILNLTYLNLPIEGDPYTPTAFDKTDWNINDRSYNSYAFTTNVKMYSNRCQQISNNPDTRYLHNNICYSIVDNIGIENISDNTIVNEGYIASNTCATANGQLRQNWSYELYNNVLGAANGGEIRDNHVDGYLSDNDCPGGIWGNNTHLDIISNTSASIHNNIITGGMDNNTGSSINNNVGDLNF